MSQSTKTSYAVSCVTLTESGAVKTRAAFVIVSTDHGLAHVGPMIVRWPNGKTDRGVTHVIEHVDGSVEICVIRNDAPCIYLLIHAGEHPVVDTHREVAA